MYRGREEGRTSTPHTSVIRSGVVRGNELSGLGDGLGTYEGAQGIAKAPRLCWGEAFKKPGYRVPVVVQRKSLARIHEDVCLIPGLAQWAENLAMPSMSCGIGHRCGSDPTLLWLWHRPAVTARIQPLAWEPPCAPSAALKSKIIKK